MKRYLLHMSYIGSNFRGMQRQSQFHPTVQQTVEKALADSLHPPSLFAPILNISSRTDSGVHALSTTSHVDLIHPKDGEYNMYEVMSRMNNKLSREGHEIRIISCKEISQHLHARHSAISRSYLYRFMTQKEEGRAAMPAIELNRCYAIRSVLFDINRARSGTKLFLGIKDFRTFSGKINNRYMNTEIIYLRKLDYFTIEKGQSLLPEDPLTEKFNFWNVRCGAKSFLYNQVRRMVGALIALGIGKVTEKDVRCMLQVPSRNSWDPRVIPAPAHGLYLCNVEYDPIVLEQNTIKKE